MRKITLPPLSGAKHSRIKTLILIALTCFFIFSNRGQAQSVLTFEQAGSTTSWTENGINWTFADGSADIIDVAFPRNGTGHWHSSGNPTAGTLVAVGTDIRVDGLYMYTDNSTNISNLIIRGFDASGTEIINSSFLSPIIYDGAYTYLSLGWTNIRKISIEWDDLGGGIVFVDDMDYCALPTITGQPTDQYTCQGSTATYTITANNVTSYQWQENAGGGFADLSDDGTYFGTSTATLFFNNTNGRNYRHYRCKLTNACTTIYSFGAILDETGAAGGSLVNSTSPLCAGGSDGMATVAGAGLGPFTYSWSSGGTLDTETGLAAGTYTCAITNVCSNTYNQIVTISGASAITPSVMTQSNPSCNGAFNGQINMYSYGGAFPHSYSWSSGGTSSMESGLPAGTHTCTITDANGCSIDVPLTLTDPPAITGIVNSQTDPSCPGLLDGSIDITGTGGNGSFTYSWSPAGGTSSIATGLGAATYTCMITDYKGCFGDAMVTINDPAPVSIVPAIQIQPTCHLISDGVAGFTVSGGTGPYDIYWYGNSAGFLDNGPSDTHTGLGQDLYHIEAFDIHGCSEVSADISILDPSPITAWVDSQTDVSCNGASDGTVTLLVVGGTGAYSYAWSPAGGTANPGVSMPAGNYTCTVSDVNGCTFDAPLVVSEPTLLTLNISAQTDASCFGYSDGSLDVTGLGGTAPYTYSWLHNGATTSLQNGLAADTYTCSVTDNNGCTSNNQFIVSEPGQITILPFQSEAGCFGQTLGTAAVSPTGGLPSYTYNWSPGTPAGDGTDNVSGLAAGTYSCTVTDATGCFAVQSYTITEYSQVTGTDTPVDVTCFGANDGISTINASGGTGPYIFDWQPIGPGSITMGSLTPGTYTVVISDNNGCTGTVLTTINEPPAINISILSQNDVTCNGGSNGDVTVSVTGGVGSYLYGWSPVGGAGASASGLTAGTYTVDVVDGNNCPASQTVIINQPALLSGTINVLSQEGCAGSGNGSAQAIVSGGVSPYNYSWSSSSNTTDTETGLSAGTYTCSFTDANTCAGTATATITAIASTDIFGRLTLSSGAILGGTAYAFKVQPSANGIDTVAVAPVFTGVPVSYLFSGLQADNYLIKVILDTSMHPTAVPTYYGNTFQWDSSLVVNHGCLQTDTADIDVLEILPQTGTGFVSGFVLEGPGFQSLRLNSQGGHHPYLPCVPGGPLKGIDVKLGKNPGGGIQARMMTDSTGYYSFSDIPDGNYRIYVDIPNMPMDSLRQVTINSSVAPDSSIQNNYFADSLIIYVADTTITPVGIFSSAKVYDNKFSIYPNPTTNVLNLQFTTSKETEEVAVEITNAIGTRVHSIREERFTKGGNSITLHAKELHLNAGVYFISIITDNKRYTQRIVVVE